ncbi:MAG: NAD(P)H-hydrate dehydratase, partial [Bacteriovoracaceae bacterium]|nr:NAD(P)H-hydrate dehydratase [Bacteriovoracaceae bacterium]
MSSANPISYTVNDLGHWWPSRTREGHKYDHGNVLIIGGSPSLTGAPILAALAAASCGAGKVTVATWEISKSELVARTPPYIIPTAIERLFTSSGEQKSAGPNTSYDFAVLEKFDAVVLGPGLGINSIAQNFLNQLVKISPRPLGPWIVDADAFRQWKFGLTDTPTIFTPHLGELSKVLMVPSEQIKTDGQHGWPQFAQLNQNAPQVTLVLTSSTTWIWHLAQVEYVWNFPNATLGKAGSGDILVGIMAALAAVMPQEDLAKVAALAVGVHGLMGKIAQEK